MILDEIKALLVADAGVLALVSTRIYDTVLPRGYQLPAVVQHIAASHSDYTMQGSSPPEDITVQFDVYANTAASARAIREALEDVLQNFKGVLSGGSIVQATLWACEHELVRDCIRSSCVSGTIKEYI
jgi:Protein of unknown function (DUF3168)